MWAIALAIGWVKGRFGHWASKSIRSVTLARAVLGVEVRSFLCAFALMVAFVLASDLVEGLVFGCNKID